MCPEAPIADKVLIMVDSCESDLATGEASGEWMKTGRRKDGSNDVNSGI